MQVRKVLLASAITLFALACSSGAGLADERSTSTDPQRLEARKTAQSVVDLYEEAFNRHDARAISMLFVPDGVFLPPNASPVVQGRDEIERSWAGLFKNVGGHETVTIKDALPAGNDAVVAVTEWQLVGDVPPNKTISGRATITLTKTPEGWRYVVIAAQSQPAPSNGQKQ